MRKFAFKIVILACGLGWLGFMPDETDSKKTVDFDSNVKLTLAMTYKY